MIAPNRTAYAPREIGAGTAAAEIVSLNARLRLCCAALDIKPEDVRLGDLAAGERARLMREGTADFWVFINNGPT